jgi:uncharacterized protein
MLMDWLAIQCLLALAAGALVQGAAGFGFGLVSIGLMGLTSINPKTAAILPFASGVSLLAGMVMRYRRHIAWRDITAFLPGALVGVPIGVYCLIRMPVHWVYGSLGGLLLFSGFYALMPHTRRQSWHRVWVGFPLGIASGALGGAFSSSGPPAIAFMTNRDLNRFQFVASLQAVFFCGALLRVPVVVQAGLVDRWTWTVSLIGIPLVLAASRVGGLILSMLSDTILRRTACVAQIALGIVYVFRTVSP